MRLECEDFQSLVLYSFHASEDSLSFQRERFYNYTNSQESLFSVEFSLFHRVFPPLSFDFPLLNINPKNLRRWFFVWFLNNKQTNKPSKVWWEHLKISVVTHGLFLII